MDNLPNQLWAKLVSLKPNKQSIHISSQPEGFKAYKIDNQWQIYERSTGGTWLTNLSTATIEVGDQVLNQLEEMKITNGDIIAYSKRDQEDQEEDFGYVICFMDLLSINPLKRNREEDDTVIVSSPQSIEVSKHFKQGLKEELTCPICLGILHRCVTLDPCQHNYCSSCLLNHIKTSVKCPVCRKEAKAVRKNVTLQSVIDVVLKNSPEMSRQKETKEYELMELHGNIIIKEGTTFIVFETNGRMEGKGHAIREGGVVQGTWVDGRMEGEGIGRLNNGTLIKGQWANDTLHHIDEITISGVGIYKGQTKGLRANGKGTLKYEWGDIYEGYFKDDKKEGTGKYTWENGDMYDGNWINNKRNGYGTLKYSNGVIYSGDWKDGKKEGLGKYTWQNGDMYDGNWTNNERNGYGTMKYSNGVIYNGDWRDDKKEGIGKLTFRHGDQYEGGWINNHENGMGKYTWKNGQTLNGIWFMQTLQPLVKIQYTNGDTYEGEIDIKSFKKHGKGIFTPENGRKYFGSWVNDKQQN